MKRIMAVLNSAKCLMVPDGKLFVLRLRRTDVQIVIVDIDDYDQLQELRERERGRGRGGERQTDGRTEYQFSICYILLIGAF